MGGLSGWLLCLVNLLVFSTISTTRCLYYRCKVACTATTWCLWPHCKRRCTGTLLTNQLAEVSFKAGSTTSALSLHRNYSGIRRINYY